MMERETLQSLIALGRVHLEAVHARDWGAVDEVLEQKLDLYEKGCPIREEGLPPRDLQKIHELITIEKQIDSALRVSRSMLSDDLETVRSLHVCLRDLRKAARPSTRARLFLKG